MLNAIIGMALIAAALCIAWGVAGYWLYGRVVKKFNNKFDELAPANGDTEEMEERLSTAEGDIKHGFDSVIKRLMVLEKVNGIQVTPKKKRNRKKKKGA